MQQTSTTRSRRSSRHRAYLPHGSEQLNLHPLTPLSPHAQPNPPPSPTNPNTAALPTAPPTMNDIERAERGLPPVPATYHPHRRRFFHFFPLSQWQWAILMLPLLLEIIRLLADRMGLPTSQEMPPGRLAQIVYRRTQMIAVVFTVGRLVWTTEWARLGVHSLEGWMAFWDEVCG